MQPVVSIRGIGKQFDAVRALDDVSFEVMPGETHAVMGENGAGKSTLMKILSGVISDYEGQVWVHGQQQRFQGTRDAERAGIGIIHQELNLVEPLSVAANIFLGREIRNVWGVLKQAEMDRQAVALLRQLDSSLTPSTAVGTLRVGDQQMIEIAKALALEASILIMDEPTSALTESEVERLYGVIAKLRQRGVTILYISHKMDEVFNLADRITVLRDGRLVETVVKADSNPRSIAHLMVGRELEARSRTSAASPSASSASSPPPLPLLHVAQLSLAWPGRPHVDRLRNISFELYRGEILGIAGLMGAGRTELLECLFGASVVPPSGDIVLNGVPHTLQHPAEAMRAGIAMVSEDRKRLGLLGHMTVRENISLCALQDFASLGVIARGREASATRRQVHKMAIKADGVEASIHSLSGGNQQKCILARCMLTAPQILLLDDPTRGVDVGAKAELYRLMEQLAGTGMGIIVTSSELPELLTVCDRILVLSEGRISGEFTRAEATEEKIMEAATQSAAAAEGLPGRVPTRQKRRTAK
ncbi:MAG: sugar ABC transporter ATP-binding protein [Planctomycetales bacterium]|nr:sugar ABC transporter ATP-binding protein [Planctomycetales bacterium]